MRQLHVAGERMFVDYAGTTLEVVDGTTGEVRVCQLFVAALGAQLRDRDRNTRALYGARGTRNLAAVCVINHKWERRVYLACGLLGIIYNIAWRLPSRARQQ